MSDNTNNTNIWTLVIGGGQLITGSLCAYFAWRASPKRQRTGASVNRSARGLFIAAAILGTGATYCLEYVLYIWLRQSHPYILLTAVLAACALIPAMWVMLLRTPEPKLVIHRAVYGAGLETDTDITETLRNTVQDGLVIPVDNDLVPRDLAKGTRKRLEIQYSYGNGAVCYAYRLESTQGDIVRLVLPEDSEVVKLTSKVAHLSKELEVAKATNEQLRLQTPTSQQDTLQLSPLQRDALQLSSELLGFINRLGPPPAPKYTAVDIAHMSASQMKALREDGDFLDALEYHNEGQVPFNRTQLESQLIARGSRLYTWYQKFAAAYALERFEAKVDTLRNRFLLEGLTDNVLLMPIEGKYGEDRVRNIAAKLWELAYKAGEKGIVSENA
jgi:hypothetical protein